MSILKRLGLLSREGMKSFNAGRHADALFQLSQAESIARQMSSPLHEAKIQNNIGLVHLGAGEFDKALTRFRIAEQNAIKGAGVDNCLHKVIKRNLCRVAQAA